MVNLVLSQVSYPNVHCVNSFYLLMSFITIQYFPLKNNILTIVGGKTSRKERKTECQNVETNGEIGKKTKESPIKVCLWSSV